MLIGGNMVYRVKMRVIHPGKPNSIGQAEFSMHHAALQWASSMALEAFNSGADEVDVEIIKMIPIERVQ
jgi:hypothetical protein